MEFDKGQPGRVDLARFLVDKILIKDLRQVFSQPIKIVELGCGAGDISGPYSSAVVLRDGWVTYPAEVHGYDVVPAAKEACARRWPNMQFHLGPVEDQPPQECDLLIMCEFLEHVDDPVKIVQDWLPLAKWAIIGHPLNEPDPPYEPGHIWSYRLEDWHRWFTIGGHHIWERFLFPMGYWDNMVMGHSCRLDQPPLQ